MRQYTFPNVDETRSKNMRAISSKDTKPEIIVRKVIRALGYGYRLHRKDIPGRPDIALIGRKKAIFVHGCFWHQHDDPNCPRSHVPKSRVGYWEEKFNKNKMRDKKNLDSLQERGWKHLIVWECQTKDASELKKNLSRFLGGSKS